MSELRGRTTGRDRRADRRARVHCDPSGTTSASRPSVSTRGRPVTRATGSSTSTTSRSPTATRSSTSFCEGARVRARRRPGGRARRHARLRPSRREANGVRRGARDDDHRARRHPGKGVRARRLGTLGPARPRSTRRASTPRPPIADANWSRLIRSTPGCSTTSPAARASPAGRLTRSSTSGTRSTCRSGFARTQRTIRTSIRSATSPRSRS